MMRRYNLSEEIMIAMGRKYDADRAAAICRAIDEAPHAFSRSAHERLVRWAEHIGWRAYARSNDSKEV